MNSTHWNLLKLLEKHLLISQRYGIADAIKPLEEAFGVKYFTFFRIFPDESRIILSSKPEVNYFYHEAKLYKTGFSVKFKDYKPGFYLTSLAVTPLQCTETFIQVRNKFNLDHGLIIINKYKHHVDFAFFKTDKDNSNINNAYLNHRHIFSNFVKDFIASSQAALRCAYASRYRPGNFYPEGFDTYNLNKAKMKLNILTGQNVLSSQEKQTLILEGLGHHDKTVAKLMHRSPETIKTYAKSIKKKLGAKTKMHALVRALLNKEISLAEIQDLEEAC